MPYGLSETVIKKLLDVFSSTTEIDEVVLFGSRAKGNFKEGSDIDLALKGINLSINTIRKFELDIDNLLLPYVVDLVIYNNITEPLLTAHIDRAGICLYKKIIQ
jgi:predicted nucleotidyltransferase